MTIGQRIKQARKSSQFSLRDLAERAQISPMAISKYERDLDMPGSAVIVRLSEALGVPVDFFFRASALEVQLQAYRRHASLGVKEQDAIQARIQEWLERYLEVEAFFGDASLVELPRYEIAVVEDAEAAAEKLRSAWELGLDPIENLTQLLEDQGIKVGVVDGYVHFDACTFLAGQAPVIVTKANLPGDRQRFNLGHELGHLVLEAGAGLDVEKISHRFVGAFLVPAQAVRFELGQKRTSLDMNELYLLKQKYGLSMQAWIFRARDLGIISPQVAERLFQHFRANDWQRQEPGKPYPSENPLRMERLIYRALVEDLISRSRAQELLGKPLQQCWVEEALQNDFTASAGY
jgi:Zn-dependent peptidase ImmA (M78 family)/DNA-binding XRE family transcriptional regulator